MSDSNAFAPGYMMNKKVVVSGGTSGIGLAIARGFQRPAQTSQRPEAPPPACPPQN